jgi:PhzF family phenazine biosynthesis protein
MTDVLKFAALCDAESGGLSAGVCLVEALPEEDHMQAVAAEAGCSQTVFAMPAAGGWKVRYFSPTSELEFGSHATIALGAALAAQHDDGSFVVTTVGNRLLVEGSQQGDQYVVALTSPPTRSGAAPGPLVEAVLHIFDYGKVDLHKRIPSARVHVGADHLVIGLASREALAARHFGLAACRLLMTSAGLETLLLVWPETTQRFHTRNPFADGGFHEDPASIASTAALASYLRDLRWPHGGTIEVVQGGGSDQHAVLRADIPSEERGAPVRVSGLARFIA